MFRWFTWLTLHASRCHSVTVWRWKVDQNSLMLRVVNPIANQVLVANDHPFQVKIGRDWKALPHQGHIWWRRWSPFLRLQMAQTCSNSSSCIRSIPKPQPVLCCMRSYPQKQKMQGNLSNLTRWLAEVSLSCCWYSWHLALSLLVCIKNGWHGSTFDWATIVIASNCAGHLIP